MSTLNHEEAKARIAKAISVDPSELRIRHNPNGSVSVFNGGFDGHHEIIHASSLRSAVERIEDDPTGEKETAE